jgi:phosphatidylglycerophosphatase C
MTTVAAFDFDGTITRRNTLFHFLLFSFGYSKVLLGFLMLSKVLLYYKIGIISNGQAKEQVFSFFFKGMPVSKFQSLCNDFAAKIEAMENKEAMEKIAWHLKQNHQVVIVTASISNWIRPWAATKSITDVIATEIEVVNNIVTGKFATPNCYGFEKAARLEALFPNLSDIYLYAYGDSKGDQELLRLAHKSFYRCF